MAFNLDLSNLAKYINENRDLLISKVASVTDSTKWMNIQDGVTADTAIHGLITNLKVQDGSDCGFTPDGSQTVTERTLVPNYLKVNQDYCPKDFYGTYMHYQTQVAMGKSTLPLEEALVNDVIKAIAEENERLLWSGSKASGDLVDGFATIIANDSAIPSANKFTSSKTTVLERVMEMYEKVNNKKYSIVCSMPMYRSLIMDLVNKNLFVYHEDENNDHTFTIPATNIVVYGIEGLADTDTNLYGVIWDEMFVGVDTADDESKFEFAFNQSSRKYDLIVEWVLTCNYMFSENIWVYSI